jgi:hypothetical protein
MTDDITSQTYFKGTKLNRLLYPARIAVYDSRSVYASR